MEASFNVNLSDEEGADNFDQISHDSSDSDEVDSSDIETNEIPEVDAELGNFYFAFLTDLWSIRFYHRFCISADEVLCKYY